MVKSLISILSQRQTNILSGASILMVTVFASKFLGLIRDRLLVHQFSTDQAAIFFAAFKLPDLMFNLFIFGALSVAFIPVFTDEMHKKGDQAAFEFANNILNLSLVFFTLIAILSFVFVGPLNSLLVPGFEGQQKTTTDQLTQIMLLSQILLVIGSFFVGISQSFQRFIIPSLAPVMYNLGIIFGIGVLAPYLGVAGPAYGVVIGAAMHVLIQLPMVNALGYRYRFSFDFWNSGVREVFKMMSARNIGLAVEQFNDAVGTALASLVSYSSVTILTFAQHLQFVPIGLFGATIAQAALPALSASRARGDMEGFKATLLNTMHQILFLSLPAAAILIVLRIPVVRLTFGASQFNWFDTVLTGRTLAFLALGLVAQSVILLLVRGFYALKDTRTPVTVSIISAVVNIVLSFTFIQIMHLEVWSLGLAFSISANLSFMALIYFLDRKVGGFANNRLFTPLIKMVVAAILAAIALYIPIKALDQLVFDTTKTINLLFLTGIASAFGIGVYLFLIWVFRVEEIYTYVNLLKRLVRLQGRLRSKEISPDQPPGV